MSCIIENHKPIFIGVSEVLKKSTDLTKELLGKELKVKKDELNQMWHNSTLEKIFIEKRIYRNIEDKESWEDVLNAINKGLEPFINLLKKDINEDDIIRLTEIKIKKEFQKYDIDKADKIKSN